MIDLGLASLALSAGGTIASSIGSAQTNKERLQAIKDNYARQKAYYQLQANQDPTLRSDNANTLRLLSDKIEDQNKTNIARNKITGATQEMNVAQKQSNAKVMGNAVGSIASTASSRADHYNDLGAQAKMQESASLDALNANRSQQWANLASNASQLGASALQTFGSEYNPKDDKKTSSNTTSSVGRQKTSKADKMVNSLSALYDDSDLAKRYMYNNDNIDFLTNRYK